jgi:hypothetical protein
MVTTTQKQKRYVDDVQQPRTGLSVEHRVVKND